MNQRQQQVDISTARINALNANNTVQYLKQRLEQMDAAITHLEHTVTSLEARLTRIEQQLEDTERDE